MIGDAQKILDETRSKGIWMAQSVWDALEIEAHNDRCTVFLMRHRSNPEYPNGCPILSDGPQRDDL